MYEADLERMRSLVVRRQRLTERHPLFFPVAVRLHRMRRRLRWARSCSPWASAHTSQRLPVRIKVHTSPLLREPGESEMPLQYGKVGNLRIAADRLDGLLIRPGEVVSFNRLVGDRGSRQLANLIHWMVLHSPLTVTERSEHSVDPFPDNGGDLPWGTGCSIVYNDVDLCFRNDTDLTFALSVRVGERHLGGELRASAPPAYSYSVFARGEAFLRLDGEYFRRNEIWRRINDRRTGERVGEELLRRNCALVRYVPHGVEVTDVTPDHGRVADPRTTGAPPGFGGTAAVR